MKSHTLETREDCVDVVRKVCTEAEEEVDNEVCYYVYNKETQETEATTLTVDYEVKCEEETSRACPPTSNYGGYAGAGGYCKEEKAEVCYNLPTVSPATVAALVPTPAGPVGPAVVPPPPTPTSLTLAGETVVVEKSPVNVQGCNHAQLNDIF